MVANRKRCSAPPWSPRCILSVPIPGMPQGCPMGASAVGHMRAIVEPLEVHVVPVTHGACAAMAMLGLR